MNKVSDNEFFKFFLLSFQVLGYKAVSVFPRTGTVIAIKKKPQEMIKGKDEQFSFKLNVKEYNFFQTHKEYCNQWLLTERNK